MPIDFPPPPAPVQVDAARLRADAASGVTRLELAGFIVQVHAPGVLTQEDILAASIGLPDLTSLVRALAATAQQRGTLLPRTLYARSGNTLYVTISAGSVGNVNVPGPLEPYFEGLDQLAPLTIDAFEKRRLLAGVHATRMGANLTTVFTPTAASTFDLSLKPAAEPASPGSIRLNFSNAGNRFTGREFLDLDARRGTSAGDEFSLFARSSVRVLGVDAVEPGSEYREFQLGWSRVTPVGFLSASGRYLDYRQQLSGLAFNGELWTTDLSYTDIYYASTTSRITAQAKLDYIDKQLTLNSDGQQLQKETYPSLELGAAWSASFRRLSRSWLGIAALSVRQGLGGSGNTLTRSQLDYWLLRPSYLLRSQGEHFTIELQTSLQYAGVTVPEQQQWIIGGIGNLQAFVPGVVVGDRGVLLRLAGEYKGVTRGRLSLRPRAFVEFAAAESAEQFADLPSRDSQSLADVGAELAAGYSPWFEAALITAVPVHHHRVSRVARDAARADFFFRVTAKF